MSRREIATKGMGGPKVEDRINVSPKLEALADDVDIAALHDAADGFIRANDFIEAASDNAQGNLNSDVVLQAIEDGIALGARLARAAGVDGLFDTGMSVAKRKGRPIQMVTANDAYGVCRFYFIGTVNEVAARLKALKIA